VYGLLNVAIFNDPEQPLVMVTLCYGALEIVGLLLLLLLTPNPVFKVTPFFGTEYLTNG